MQPTTTRLSAAQRWMLVVSCLAIALVIASMAALYTALPDIAAASGATQKQLTWIVDGYTLALACLVLPAGALGDRYGRRAVLIAGLLVFAVASALPLLLDSPMWLIVARTIAGTGAALVMPSTLSLLTTGFPENKRGSAVGVWSGVAGAGAVLGILGSGLLLEQWSWLSIFVAMAVCGGALAVAAFTVPESIDESRPTLDPMGGLTAAIAVGSIVVAAIEAPVRGWTDLMVIGLFGTAAVSAAAFVAVELRVPNPMLDLRLFADRGFGSGAISVTVQYLVSFGVFMLFVQFLQLIFGYAPLMSAVALAPMVLPIIVLSAISPRLAERFGLRLLTFLGLAGIGIGLLLLSRLTAESNYPDLLVPLLVMSVGLGLCTAPATAAIIAGTPVEKHGVAAAVNDASREIGAAIGIAISGSLLAAGYSEQIASVLPSLPEQAREPVGDSLAAALEVSERSGPAGEPLADLAKDAFAHGAQQSSIALGVLTLVAAFAVGAWAPGPRWKGISDHKPDKPAEHAHEPVEEQQTVSVS